MTKKRIYLDSAAGAPLSSAAWEAMQNWFKQDCGNPSSPHRDGQRARIRIEEARDCVAGALNVQSREIIFTSGGTEANNTALLGAVRACSGKGRHIISSAVEHPSVLTPLKILEEQGYEITRIRPDFNGRINADRVKEVLRSDTILVSIMLVNNETGLIHSVSDIAPALKNHDALLHIDGVQAFGKMDTDLKALDCDFFTFSAHKIHGPKGVGGLYMRHGVPFKPLLTGGGQEANRRAGTENVPGIIGLQAALNYLLAHRDAHYAHVQSLQTRFEEGLRAILPEVVIWGSESERSPYISSIALPGYDNQNMLLRLDLAGVSVSVGSACSSGSIKPSHVIRVLSENPELVNSTIRVSYNPFLTFDHIDEALNRINSVLET